MLASLLLAPDGLDGPGMCSNSTNMTCDGAKIGMHEVLGVPTGKLCSGNKREPKDSAE